MSEDMYPPKMRQMKKKMEQAEKKMKEDALRKMIRQEIKAAMKGMKK